MGVGARTQQSASGTSPRPMHNARGGTVQSRVARKGARPARPSGREGRIAIRYPGVPCQAMPGLFRQSAPPSTRRFASLPAPRTPRTLHSPTAPRGPGSHTERARPLHGQQGRDGGVHKAGWVSQRVAAIAALPAVQARAQGLANVKGATSAAEGSTGSTTPRPEQQALERTPQQ